MTPNQTSVADSDLPIPQSSLDGFEDAIANLIFMGKSVKWIAKTIEPEDKRARKALRQRLNRMIARPEMAKAIADRAQKEMMIGLGPATSALVRRASKGRPDAIKLLFEASGFHNPKVKHEHSGDIKITMDMPRPKRHSTIDLEDDDIEDAEIVGD